MIPLHDARRQRCAFLLNEGEPLSLTWVNGRGERWETGGRLDLASGFGGRPVPGGEWRTADAEWSAGEPLFADLSGDGTLYRAALGPCDGGVALNVEYRPRAIPLKQRLADAALNLLYRLGRLTPGKADRFLFAGDARQRADGNAAFVLKAAEALGLTEGKKVTTAYRVGKQAAFYAKVAFLMGRSDTLVTDDYFPLLYHLRLAESVRVFQLWHACGAFKTVGYSRAGKRGAPRVDGPTHRCYTHVVVSAESVRPCYAEAFGIPLDRVKAVGVPRTDVFFDDKYAARKRAEFASAFPRAAGKTVILFAPTFRGDGRESAHYPTGAIDFGALAAYCRQNGVYVVFKMHPFVKDFALPVGCEDVFADAAATREINDLLFAADRLVTDYSSVIYEAALLGLPTVFYVFDREEYVAARDFYRPFESYAALGVTAESFPELLDALAADPPDRGAIDAWREENLGACDGGASERVARLLFTEGE